jgi:2-keto-3-deoxy-L-rhamnonate aldolase RhmA
MTDNLKHALEAETYPMGTWLSVGHPTVAEVSASQDVDFALIDTEHTTITLETVENMARAIDAADSPTDTIIRVPWNDHVRLKRVLDIGIDGVMVPMIDTAAEARELIDAMRYPPEGSRGIASGRAAEYGEQFTEYVKNANGSFTTIAQIESREGLQNVDDIAAVEGIDALFVGPADMSGALGVFGEDDPDELTEAMDRVVNAAAAADIAVGTLTIDTDAVADRIERGFDFLIVGKDTSSLADANREARSVYDEAVSMYRDTIMQSQQ